MGAADAILFALLALAEVTLMIHLHRRRQRLARVARMMRSLRIAVRKETSACETATPEARAIVLQQAG